MPEPERGCILACNPGSTSTKETLRHSDEELSYFDGVIAQLQFRSEKVRDALDSLQIPLEELRAVVGRGGLLRPLKSGTYRVNERMVKDLKSEERGSHASNLGGLIALSIAQEASCPAFIVDPVSVDELQDLARYSGCSLFERTSLSHALNTKAVAKRFAKEKGRPYEDLRLIVVHLGSGVSVSSHSKGRMIDVNNSREEGPFAPDRSGTVPAMALLDMCYSGHYEKKVLATKLFKRGGVASYLDTMDVQEAVKLIEAGDDKAAKVIDAMIYQVKKEIGANFAVLEGKVDGCIITGGIAHNDYVMSRLLPSLAWLEDKIVRYPGEDELQALYEGAVRVLDGEEKALDY